eukprot:16432356-Heterocapsa_arctica.AAC.1
MPSHTTTYNKTSLKQSCRQHHPPVLPLRPHRTSGPSTSAFKSRARGPRSYVGILPFRENPFVHKTSLV